MKVLFYGIIGMLFGGLLGLFLASGESNTYKKSQRSIAFPILAIGLSIAGGIGGCYLGISLIVDDKKMKSLGLDTIQNKSFKEGQKWVCESKWTNPNTQQIYILKTHYDYKLSTSVSSLNGTIINNYGVKTGAKSFIFKTHKEALQGLIKNLKNS